MKVGQNIREGHQEEVASTELYSATKPAWLDSLSGSPLNTYLYQGFLLVSGSIAFLNPVPFWHTILASGPEVQGCPENCGHFSEA